MPWNYIIKTDHQNWSKTASMKAVDAVKKNAMGLLMASKVYGGSSSNWQKTYTEAKQNLGTNYKGFLPRK